MCLTHILDVMLSFVVCVFDAYMRSDVVICCVCVFDAYVISVVICCVCV